MVTNLVIHTLRDYAPSSLNRGGDGSPKSCHFNETWRARISSQSVKRSIRSSEAFETFASRNLTEIRSRQLPALVAAVLARRNWNQDDIEKASDLLSGIGRKSGTDEKKPGQTNQMIMIPTSAIVNIADQLDQLVLTSAWTESLEAEKILQPVDMMSIGTALFGTMTTSAVFGNVAAACQVSHAFSTNQSHRMIDYFTAVDDWTGESSMIGDSYYNSNCYYWSMIVNLPLLINNLHGDDVLAIEVVGALLRAIGESHPSGKQNSFASHPPLGLMMVEARPGRMVIDHAEAFAKPVTPTSEGLTHASLISLGEHILRSDKMHEPPAYRVYSQLLDENILPGTRLDGVGSVIKDVVSYAGK